MEEFLEYVLRQMVEHPDEMVITHVEAPRKVIFKVQLRQSDVGRVIGRHGQTIRAIRAVMNAGAALHGQKTLVQIVEEGGGEVADSR